MNRPAECVRACRILAPELANWVYPKCEERTGGDTRPIRPAQKRPHWGRECRVHKKGGISSAAEWVMARPNPPTEGSSQLSYFCVVVPKCRFGLEYRRNRLKSGSTVLEIPLTIGICIYIYIYICMYVYIYIYIYI